MKVPNEQRETESKLAAFVLSKWKCFGDKINADCTLIKNSTKTLINAVTNKTIMLGDVNLDWFKCHSNNYALRNMFAAFEDKLQAHNLIQVIDSRTWNRTVNNTVRKFCLDYIDLQNLFMIV